MPIIYIDVLLCINLFIDFLLLCATARVLRRPYRRRRLIGGAVVGALSSLSILLPPMPTVLSLLLRLIVAALMVLCAFAFVNVGTFFKTTAVMFVISAIFAGICFALWWLVAPSGLFVRSGVVYYDVPPLWLLLFTVISYAVLCVYERLTRKRVALHLSYRVEIIDHDCRICLRALLDSGHSLTERFSGAPVILVNADAVSALTRIYDPAHITAHTASRIRYIPFHTLSGEGLLAACRPEKVVLHANGKTADISGVWIAATAMLARGEYDALISPALADRFILTKEGSPR